MCTNVSKFHGPGGSNNQPVIGSVIYPRNAAAVIGDTPPNPEHVEHRADDRIPVESDAAARSPGMPARRCVL
jgi:hypothetical protein